MGTTIEQVMEIALEVATQSPDPSTQNGAVIISEKRGVMVHDCNRFPDGVQYSDERWERPAKYEYVEHAERGSVFKAARLGIPTNNAVMVAVWAACSDCARAIVQSGIKTLVRGPNGGAAHWDGSISIGDTILLEGGVNIVDLDLSDFKIPTLRRNGEVWIP